MLCGLEDLKIVHQDIKLENILVSRSGHLALADLGIGVRTDHRSAIPSMIMTSFSAPEVRNTDNPTCSHKSDVWSMGMCVLSTYCRSGEFPLGGDGNAENKNVLSIECEELNVMREIENCNPQLWDLVRKVKEFLARDHRRFQLTLLL